MKASVIISFYNKIDFLKLLLAGFERQTVREYEIVIADDGSKQEVVEEVMQIAESSHLTIRHVWHEDEGWRKNKILNKAVMATTSDYLIFVDGDCIPHSKFVEDHLNERKTGQVVAARRCKLGKSFSSKLTPEKVKKGYLENFATIVLGNPTTKHFEKGLRIKSNFIANLLKSEKKGLLGCNFSLWKKDLLAINGFDERYLSPGVGEDSDLECRLSNNGIDVKNIAYRAVQYHIYHKKVFLEGDPGSLGLWKMAKEQNITETPHGIQSYDR